MKAVVLCAGLGTRLGELVQACPKPMLPVAGRPLLEYILCHLARHGCREILINLHYFPEAIPNYFGTGERWGLRLTYSHEAQLLGTAGTLRNVAKFLGGEPFLVQYGDVVTQHDLTALLTQHRARQAWGTLLVHQRVASNSVLAIDHEQRITAFLERPSDAERRTVDSPWVNSGIAVLGPEILAEIPDRQPADLPRDVYQPLVCSGKLFTMPLFGFRCAVDSPQRLAQVRAAAAQKIITCQLSGGTAVV